MRCCSLSTLAPARSLRNTSASMDQRPPTLVARTTIDSHCVVRRTRDGFSLFVLSLWPNEARPRLQHQCGKCRHSAERTQSWCPLPTVLRHGVSDNVKFLTICKFTASRSWSHTMTLVVTRRRPTAHPGSTSAQKRHLDGHTGRKGEMRSGEPLPSMPCLFRKIKYESLVLPSSQFSVIFSICQCASCFISCFTPPPLHCLVGLVCKP